MVTRKRRVSERRRRNEGGGGRCMRGEMRKKRRWKVRGEEEGEKG